MPTNYYNDNIQELKQQYSSVPFDAVHAGWSRHLEALWNKDVVRILDVGAGVGRDIKHLAIAAQSKGIDYYCVAVEPAIEMLKVGQSSTLGLNIDWIQDELPSLRHTPEQSTKFDLILLSAVWMHVQPEQQALALKKLLSLLADDGVLILTIKLGMGAQELYARAMFEINIDDLIAKADKLGAIAMLETDLVADKLGRRNIYWQTLSIKKK
ncbi:class I SAM-dependent methyltransferase [Glaciecola sp. 1036]|uniref:class I SAM-dependent methyltransferase n=1 Tax=Alteromonadaceae TaxID=72275 RepID=UPI003D0294EB